ncbi:MAG: hypothetical protein KY475_14240, partial [Planctomycetes bacterium]|nr:hypothetical protein [Planctomycetota bacterium]
RRLALGLAAALLLSLGPSAKAADPTEEILLKRISMLRSQVQAIDEQIAVLEEKMPRIEAGIEELMKKIGDLKTPDPEDEVREPEKEKPRQIGFRPPILRTEQKETPLALVCENGRVAILDFDEWSENFKRILDDSAKLEAFVDARGGTLPAGDFDMKVTFVLVGTLVLMQKDVVSRDGQAGETLEAALRPDSKLRQRLGRIDPSKAVIQFAVYSDSFDLFRSVRKEVWDQNFSVNWIPMEHGEVIPVGSGSGGVGVQG